MIAFAADLIYAFAPSWSGERLSLGQTN